MLAKNVLLEALLVAVVGAALSFLANGVFPRGLTLSRDNFPATARIRPGSAGETNRLAAAAGTNKPSPLELLAAQLQADGLQLADSNQVVQLFRDPRYQQGLIAFIDARDHDHYLEGHIPGAHEFDHFRAEKYLATLLPLCEAAQQIVVYCHGGECEDSRQAAVLLGQFGISKSKMFVYGGGITEWETNGLPIELGEKGSGNLRPPKK
jgi:rhodanese-related sulfurtransferase